VCGAVLEADGMLLVGGADPGAAEASDPGGAVPGLPFCATSLLEAFDRVEAAGSVPEGGHRVVVDFTQPHAVAENIALCVARGWPVVVGTTGLEPDALDRLAAEAERTGIPVLVAPNFAIGAVLMMEFARQAARLLDACEIVELHHEAKLDAPSGTARRTADIVEQQWAERGIVGSVPTHSVRLPGLVAHQEVIFGAGADSDRAARLYSPRIVHARRASGDPPRERSAGTCGRSGEHSLGAGRRLMALAIDAGPRTLEARSHVMETTARLKVIPLGGLGAIGKNMTVFEYGDDIVMLDAGLMFPDNEMLGIDLVLPDFSYVLERRDRLRGIILTHGHEDHVGALPFVLREMPEVPVFGTRLTLGLVNGKLGEHGLQGKTTLQEIDAGSTLRLGAFEAEFLEVCHSIPDGVAVALRTPVGVVLHSGDFKLDQTPVDCRVTALQRFGELGQSGVLLFLSDSTNAESTGFTGPEKSVGRNLDSIFAQAEGRVIMASFASHIHRLQQAFDAAARLGRSVAVVGRSMTKNINIAANLGYLTIPEGTLIRPQDIPEIPLDSLVILSTGSQGEPMSALARMAAHDHHLVNIIPGDTVVISAKPVPGNERSVHRTINRLFAAGAKVIYGAEAGVHVSGHAAAEELKMLLNLVKPRFFVPVHGEYRHLYFHAELAQATGIDPADVFIMEDGDVLELDSDGARIAGRVQAGMVFVDGLAMGDFSDVILRDRHHLATDGVAIVVITLSSQDGSIAAEPEVALRGFVHEGDIETMVEQVKDRVIAALSSAEVEDIEDVSILKAHVHDEVQRFFRKEVKRRPLVLPILVEV
jgi:ribonuclease J